MCTLNRSNSFSVYGDTSDWSIDDVVGLGLGLGVGCWYDEVVFVCFSASICILSSFNSNFCLLMIVSLFLTMFVCSCIVVLYAVAFERKDLSSLFSVVFSDSSLLYFEDDADRLSLDVSNESFSFLSLVFSCSSVWTCIKCVELVWVEDCSRERREEVSS